MLLGYQWLQDLVEQMLVDCDAKKNIVSGETEKIKAQRLDLRHHQDCQSLLSHCSREPDWKVVGRRLQMVAVWEMVIERVI